MADVKRRLIDGAGISQTADGFTVTEVITVKNVGGDTVSRQYNALTDAAVPSVGGLHPVVPGVRVVSREIESMGADFNKVRVTWETPNGGQTPLTPDDDPVWEIAVNIENTQGNTDKDGNLVVVSYTYPADYKPAPELRNQTVDQVGVVAFPKATFALRIRQAENRDVVAISGDAASYVGRVNNATFLGKPARTWLCAAVQASGSVGAVPTEATYELLYNPDTWDVPVAFTDTFDGNKTPADVVVGTGTKTVQVIGEANLNGLPI